MKPRNKKQQHIVELSGRLRPLTTAQKQWAFSHTIDHYAYRLKSGKAVCMDCGHEWQEVGFGIYRCPTAERGSRYATPKSVCVETNPIST